VPSIATIGALLAGNWNCNTAVVAAADENSLRSLSTNNDAYGPTAVLDFLVDL